MMLRTDNVLRIQTPEGIVFPLLLAGPFTRFLAWAIDICCVLAGQTLIGLTLGQMRAISLDLVPAFLVISYFCLSIGYPILAEWYWRGQTLGKRVLGLRVMDAQGLRLQPAQIVIRNLLRFVDSLPALYVVGGLSSFLSRSCQRLGDIAANTIVVRSPRLFEPDMSQILSGKYNSFRDYPVLAARLRQRFTPAEASILLRALLRRDQMEPQARIDLFREIVAHVRTIAAFPPEAVEGLTDEQYARNVVELLF
jgi:uncharacterized RDD family membrane protein YckC